jgi:murein DD-endopeptidase MepM/ murein hydrolase activator NlpD
MFAKYIVKSRNRKHMGVDFAAPQGTPVYAASSGVVLNADIGSLSDAFGQVVLIEHGDKLQSLSAHLSRIDVQIGDFVQAGQQIGLVGKTGRATGPHLHFELWRNGYPQDPLRYLPNSGAPQQRTSP